MGNIFYDPWSVIFLHFFWAGGGIVYSAFAAFAGVYFYFWESYRGRGRVALLMVGVGVSEVGWGSFTMRFGLTCMSDLIFPV